MIHRALLTLAAATVFIGTAATAKTDPWEGQALTDSQLKACAPLPSAVVAAVPAARRDSAVRLLADSEGVVLDEASAVGLLDRAAPESGLLGQRVLADAIGALQAKRAAALPQSPGGWTSTNQGELDRLLRFAADNPMPLKPLLIRGIAGFATTGHFDVADCGGVLFVLHISTGRSIPKGTHAPVIVFIDRMPAGVFAAFEAIQSR